MKLNDICKKLVKSNLNQYTIILFCLIFGVALFTSYGLLIFSPTVTNVIVDGGSTQQIVQVLYLVMGLGCLVFIMYSHSLFMKYKSQEIGVFMSLGIKRKNIKKISLKELQILLPIGSLVGMVLGLPLTYLAWGLLTLFLRTSETDYQIGWFGFVGGAIFAVLALIIIKIKTSRYINKIDIMKILKNNEEIEEVKSGNPILGVIAFILLPISIYLWNETAVGNIFESNNIMMPLFSVIIVICIYIIAAQVCELGNVVKRMSPKSYYKNIMFYNLLKLKGKQYTNTLFAVMILIAITIYAVSWTLPQVLDAENTAELQHPFDYSFRKTLDQNYDMSKDEVYKIAKENNTEITKYYEVEILAMAYDREYEGVLYRERINCISESDFNKIQNENIDVKSGEFNLYSSDKDTVKRERYDKVDTIIIGTDKINTLIKQEGIQKNILSGEPYYVGDQFVLDNKDYDKFKAESNKEARENIVMFDVRDWKSSIKFYDELRDTMVIKNNKKIQLYGDYLGKVDRNEEPIFVNAEDMTVGDYRDWADKPFAKVYDVVYGTVDYAIYSLLFIYVGVLAMVASSLILYIKILNTSWQDKVVYKNISLIGANKKYIKKIVSKQLMIIFAIPTIMGSTMGAGILSVMFSSQINSQFYTKFAFGFAIIYCLLQLVGYFITRNAVIKKNTNFINV